jgi:hypothetical protein
MSLNLTGARSKIERAKKHISDFDRERVSFLNSKPYVVLVKFDSKANVTQTMMGPVPIIPHSFATIAGDAAQNLRACFINTASV